MSRSLGILALVLLGTTALAQSPAPEATGTVSIRLRGHPSTPLKNPRVLVEGREATAEAGGSFRVEGLAGGRVVVRASAEGYQPLEYPVQLPAGGQTSVLLPLERIPGPGLVRGQLLRREGKDGATVPAAEVEVQLDGQVLARSDAEGSFVLPAVGPGPISLKFAGAGIRAQEEVVVVPPHGEASVEVVLRKAEEVLAWMRGRVRSTQGQPLQATVRIAETRRKARTRATGDFELRLPAGRYRVTFEARGYVSQTKIVDVGAGDQALFYVDLSPLEN